jgi:hypothetical protein
VNTRVAHTCCTCGAQYRPAARPPEVCLICADERQYPAADGQQWTTLDELRRDHSPRIELAEPRLLGIGMEPSFAIGQRALLVEGLLWDCIPLVDDEIEAAVGSNGGIDVIAISHPHFYTSMVEWAERFEARVLLHERDREWVMRPSERIEFWSGDSYRVSETLELIRLGGHFPGGTVCHWSAGAGGAGAILAGDIIQVVADPNWASFMWSYPNLIPLPTAEVARIRSVVEGLPFDRVYGGWWDRVIRDGAKEKVLRSADRYISALERYRASPG